MLHFPKVKAAAKYVDVPVSITLLDLFLHSSVHNNSEIRGALAHIFYC